MQSYHTDLIAKMQAVGLDSIENGACYGVTGVGCQAILARDTVTYDRRIQLLASIPVAELNSRIASAYEEWKQEIISTKAEYKNPGFDQLPIHVRRDILKVRFHRLASDTQLLLTIPAFLDSVRLYHKNNLPHLFPKYKHVTCQDILAVTSIFYPA